MKALNPNTGNLEEVYVKALDSMPVGTQMEFTGDTIPTGWEEVNDYSTTEMDTGKKWIDNKKIYRKVIDVTSDVSSGITSGTQVIFNSSPTTFNSTIDTIIDAKMMRTGANRMLFTGYTYIQRVNDNNKLVMQPNFNLTITSAHKMYLVLEYTKTS